MRDFRVGKVDVVCRLDGSKQVDVADFGLEDYFKDVVKGQEGAI